MAFTIATRHCIHDGKTKFYQTYIIEGPGKSTCVKHYGAYKNRNLITPKGGGQMIVSMHEGSGARTDEKEIVIKKQKREYTAWSSLNRLTFANSRLLHAELKEILPANEIDAVMLHITGSKLVMPDPKETPVPKAPVIEAPKPEGWGTW